MMSLRCAPQFKEYPLQIALSLREYIRKIIQMPKRHAGIAPHSLSICVHLGRFRPSGMLSRSRSIKIYNLFDLKFFEKKYQYEQKSY
jgi:hypothetical protein